MATTKKKSNLEQMAEQNAIFDMWTSTWGIKVYPAYGIDKLKFSFIEKGANGKGKSFDIYMNVEKDGAQCFDNWAYDILHGRFERVMMAEKQAGETYPKTYKFLTGQTAEKSIGIMNSKNGGYCINAFVPGKDGKKIFANVPIGFHDLRHIAMRYIASYEERRMELEKIRRMAETEQARFIKDVDEPMEAPMPEPTPAKTEQAPAETKQTAAVEVVNGGKTYNFTTVGKAVATGGGIYFPVSVNGSKQVGKLLFTDENSPKWLHKLIEASVDSSKSLTAIAVQNGTTFTYVGLAEKQAA